MYKVRNIIAGLKVFKKNKGRVISRNRRITSPPLHPPIRAIQNFRLVWLDDHSAEFNNPDAVNTVTKLQRIVNTVDTFTDVNECIDFITRIYAEKFFVVVSGTLGQRIVPFIHDMSQINSIYIFCQNKAWHEQWVRRWMKIRDVYTDIVPICEALKQAAQDCDQNSVSINFTKSNVEYLNDKQNQSFMYTQILKEILLTIDFHRGHFNDFIAYCRHQFAGNTIELDNIKKIEMEYNHHLPIWWYTYDCFLYSMLNRALREMEIDLIIVMGFFIRDLHNQIAQLHSQQNDRHRQSCSFTVYRGQGLSETDFNQLREMRGELLSFNNFLSTSKTHDVSLRFAQRTIAISNMIGVHFIITVDPFVFATPFATVDDVSDNQSEGEILFSTHSVFRIGEIRQIDGNDRLWQVNLRLTNENEPQFRVLTEYMLKETFPHLKGWYRLGCLLVKLGQFEKAEQLFNIIIDQSTDEEEEMNIYYMLGIVKNKQGHFTEAIEFYKTSLEITQMNSPQNHLHFAKLYHGIGMVYEKVNDYSKALAYYTKAHTFWQKASPANDSFLPTLYTSYASVYTKMGEYSTALSYYEKDLEISQKTLPENHPDLATSYNNIGTIYMKMDEYRKALSSIEKGLEISRKILPPYHPDLAISYSNIGIVYEKMNKFSEALSYYQQALEIRQKTLPENHADLRASLNNIDSVREKMHALSQDHSILKKSLSRNRSNTIIPNRKNKSSRTTILDEPTLCDNSVFWL